jgi:hypothetical protein
MLKVREKTEKESDIGDFLIDLLEFESGLPGWYKTKYSEILEKFCKEVDLDANNKH